LGEKIYLDGLYRAAKKTEKIKIIKEELEIEYE